MRYEDWDILLFPGDNGIPLKEFKVACHVVHDAEFSHMHGTGGLPTVCCFVPSLPTEKPFKISIHSWNDPPVSLYTKSYSKYTEAVKFEARLFIDGRLVASTVLEPISKGPYLIVHSYNASKGGDIESLSFPPFRKELLQQSLWSPADDLGRIKLVLSEGFPRDSLSMPFERVKNIVAFSFQHAPLDVLESSGIAWPNPEMWQRAPFASSMPVPAYQSEDVDSHAHSPRRRVKATQGTSSILPVPSAQVLMNKARMNFGPRRSTHPACSAISHAKGASSDPFAEANSYLGWLSGIGMNGVEASRSAVYPRFSRRTSTDISMPDYTPLECGDQQPALPPDCTMGLAGLRQDDDEGYGHPRVPTNTPTASGQSSHDSEGVSMPILSHSSSIPSDLANSLTNALLNQPMPLHFQQPAHNTPASEIKSRKENRRQQAHRASPSVLPPALSLGPEHQEMRRVSQQMYIPAGATMPVCLTGSQMKSPQNQDYREESNGIGICVIGANTSISEAIPGGSAVTGAGLEKGTKRLRNFTPVSARAFDEEDGPRRCSPSVHFTPFAGELRTEEDR
ncbi:hypothetical protein HIM_00782 [Hirsutella minnesotensis 3608]|nr:hypothetical protein HIM_00782 [Hirsutella minnesotensis 3608]